MFLGIVVGHFESEWKRVEAINSNKSESFNVFAIIARILVTYFNDRRKELEEQEEDESQDKGLVDEDPEGGGKKCKCPCTLRSFKPSGMFERIVLYCMMKICKKKLS